MRSVGVACGLVILLALGLVPQAMDAQGVASLSGVVRDSSGGALPGATVQMEAVKGGRRFAQSDAQGRYAFKDVIPGAYRVTASLSSFTPGQADVTLAAGQSATKDFSLDFSFFANVTVTPRKREEQILDVPAAITAVGTASIQEQ
ncbi:MAG TPA: carboxypeptidase-like regulatory domain-containing protein, partial [Thermoanaerobaculia bacterium]|nr:carboxypeptidase-like regulatory domain-containing protein [Thermoanaerobaculia bacterium]